MIIFSLDHYLRLCFLAMKTVIEYDAENIFSFRSNFLEFVELMTLVKIFFYTFFSPSRIIYYNFDIINMKIYI